MERQWVGAAQRVHDCKPRAATRGATGAAVSAAPLALRPLALVCAATAAVGPRRRVAPAAGAPKASCASAAHAAATAASSAVTAPGATPSRSRRAGRAAACPPAAARVAAPGSRGPGAPGTTRSSVLRAAACARAARPAGGVAPAPVLAPAASQGRRPRTAAVAAASTTGSAGGSGAPSSAQRSAAVAVAVADPPGLSLPLRAPRRRARVPAGPRLARSASLAPALSLVSRRRPPPPLPLAPWQRLALGPRDQRASLVSAEPVNPAPLPPTVSVAPPAERCDKAVQCDLLSSPAPAAAHRVETADAACGRVEAEPAEPSELPAGEVMVAASAAAASATALALLVAAGAEVGSCPTAALAAAAAAASAVEAEVARGLLDEGLTHRLDGTCAEGVEQATSVARPRGGSSIAAAAAAAATAKALADLLPPSDGVEKGEGDALSTSSVCVWPAALRLRAGAIIPIAAAVAAAAAGSAVRAVEMGHRPPLSEASDAVADEAITWTGLLAEAVRAGAEPQPEPHVCGITAQDCESPYAEEKRSTAPRPCEGECECEGGVSIECPCAETRKPAESPLATEDLVVALPDGDQAAFSAASTAFYPRGADGGVASRKAGDDPLVQPLPMPARVGGVLRSKRLKTAINAVALVLAQRPRVGGVLRSKRWKIAEAAALETAFR
eukprot:m51a1_g2902 hypothetical protein (671) ;mRNA; r:473863-477271